MKKIALIFCLTFLTVSYSQADTVDVKELEKERRGFVAEGFYKLSLGVFGNFVAISHIAYTDKMTIGDYIGFLLYGGSSLTFDILAFRDFNEARKIKKKLKEIQND